MLKTLSILDQSVSASGRGEDDAIRETLAAAQAAEALGYHRYWLSEHHSLQTIVGSAPEVLLAAIAARTSRIRLGSAGVMLPHYSALHVAEQFRVLEALAPGRIDLGVGRAPGSDMRTARALNPNAAHAADEFPQQVQWLQAWSSGRTLQGITAHPRGPQAPVVWMLGSSDYGARLAAHLGLPYAFAYFFMDGQGAEEAVEAYRSLYQPSARHPTPQVTLCVWALAADSDDEAAFQALPRERWRIDRQRGVFGPLRPPEAIRDEGFRDDEAALAASLRRSAFVGRVDRVADRLRTLADRFELDELVINTWSYDPAVRLHSMALLARAFELPGSSV